MSVDAATLRIVKYPEAVLRATAEPVGRVNEGVRAVATRMLELMHEAPGVGLAGPQVGLGWRLFVANWLNKEGEDHVFIDPELEVIDPSTAADEEGCLSLPEIRGRIMRPVGIRITATNLAGERFTLQDAGFAARVWQHENDHLDGVLILDKFTPIDRVANRRLIRELERA